MTNHYVNFKLSKDVEKNPGPTQYNTDHHEVIIKGFGGKRALGNLRKIELCQKRSKFRMQFCLGVLNNVLHVFFP